MATVNRLGSCSCRDLLTPFIKQGAPERSLNPVSAPQAQLGDEGPVPLHVLTTQVVEETAALADHQQQAAPAVVVVLVGSKMLGEVVDSLGEQGDLDLGGSGVALVGAEFGNDLRCGFHHAVVSRPTGGSEECYHP